MISNGLVALSSALLAQYQGFADVNMGRGAIVIGLAAVIIGEAIFGKIFHNFALRLLSVAFGSILYYLVLQTVIWMGIDTDLLKMLSRDALKLTDAGLVGLEEQLKALKESDGYLFEGDKPAPEIVKPGSPIRRTPAGGGDLDDFYANNPFYKKKA